jgi:putative SOS response-associated peptidase YedK
VWRSNRSRGVSPGSSFHGNLTHMCYSAEAWADYDRYVREFGATISMRDFAEIYGHKPIRKRKRPKAMDDAIRRGSSPEERAIAATLDQDKRDALLEWQAELFKQKRRLADGERVMTSAKPTKKAENDVRVASNKIDQLLRWISDAERVEPMPRDSRMYPNHYVPIMVWEDGRRIIKPMRYLLRRAGKAAKEDDMYPGCYNARRDNLEKFWKAQFGVTHGVMVVEAFYENVSRHAMENRPLGPNEHEENVILEFRPRPAQSMVIACLWSAWSAPGEEDLLSFAAITDEPPAEVAAAGHDRCIIQIKPENIDEWLQGGNISRMQEILDDRALPYYEHRLAA